MSKYLHFGQVWSLGSPSKARTLRRARKIESFIEELLVRRELAINLVGHTEYYDRYDLVARLGAQTLRSTRAISGRSPTRGRSRAARAHDAIGTRP